ncbi:200 kDa antigen p200, putative [Stigmatella aurantiaca DW4/3-1]|uniref:200 kDa antigen p200, putative n=1 Tax=Stigmatella aurantiaca (strain DW4/3-1) TaxID=378806 RepID=Q08UX0_STIAD|nr:200 kDa antigen p200, putative [Stigmatella aurantiaca DW4/3-1]
MHLQPQILEGHEPQHHQEGPQAHERRQGREHPGGEPLARHHVAAPHGVDEQRLQRTAFALPRHGVDGHVHSAHEGGEDEEVRDDVQGPRRQPLRRGQVHLVHLDGRRQLRRDAARQEALPSQHARVGLEHRPQALGVDARLIARAVHHHLHRGRMPRGEVLAVVLGDDEHRVQLAGLEERLVVRGRLGELGAVALEEGHEAGGMLAAHHRHFQGLGVPVPGGHQREEHRGHERPEQRPHERARHRAPVPEVVLQLLAEDRGEEPLHCINPWSVPMAEMKASSRLSLPVRARSSSGVPSATTRPRATTTMRSHRAVTSCITWLEKSTQCPSALRRRMMVRTARVLITSRPLVGSSRSTLRGPCTSPPCWWRTSGWRWRAASIMRTGSG